MLLFSTMLAINEKMDKEDFIRLVIEWNQNSPHKKNVIPNFEWRGKYRERYGNDTSWMEFESYNDGAVIACRYENVETDGTVWNTDYIEILKSESWRCVWIEASTKMQCSQEELLCRPFSSAI